MAKDKLEEMKTMADDVRLEDALQTIKDILWRFEENCEGRRAVYEVLGCLVEDLTVEGVCPACIAGTMTAVFDAMGVDTKVHVEDDDSVFH
ncbi:MAG: hypothetical protein ACFHX7_17250 [Pseudomonadota bacterium]